jgi:hypothetical protein
MTPDNCPLCGTSVALLRRPEARGQTELLRDRIVTLRERAVALRGRELTPRRVKDEALWMCPSCQRLITTLDTLDERTLGRRIDEEVRRLERDTRRAHADRREPPLMKTPASMAMVIEGTRNRAFTTRVRAKVAEILGRIDPPPTTAKVMFADENGPKGGPGIRCTIVHDMPRRRDFSVQGVGATEEVAFDAAFDALETSITRDRTRRRELVRRPKKYYLAKRLLSPDATLASEVAPESAAAAPRPKRARRRRVA